MATIDIPGHGPVEFADTMSPEAVKSAIQKITGGTQVPPGPAPSAGPAVKAAQEASAPPAASPPAAGVPPAGAPAAPPTPVPPAPPAAPPPEGPLGSPTGIDALDRLIPLTTARQAELAALSQMPFRERLQDWATESGMMLASAGAGSMWQGWVKASPLLVKLGTPVVRVIMGALGAEAGNVATGGTPGAKTEGALVGGTLAEALPPGVKGVGKAGAAVARHVPGVKNVVASRAAAREAKLAPVRTAQAEATAAENKAQAAQGRVAKLATDLQAAQGAEAAAQRASNKIAKGVGGALGEVAPPMAPAARARATAEAKRLRELGVLSGESRQFLGEYQSSKLVEATAHLPPGTKIAVPAMRQHNPEWDEAAKAMGLNPALPMKPEWRKAIDQHVGAPQYNDRFTLVEVAEHMKNLGLKGFGGAASTSATRTMAGKPLRVQYGEIMGQVEQQLTGLSPAAWTAFREGRHAFSVGNEIIRVLKQERLWATEGGATAIDPRQFQKVMAKHAQRIKERMTADEWKSFHKVVWGNREIGSVSAPSLVKSRAATARARAAHGAMVPEAAALQTQATSQRAAASALAQSMQPRPWGDKMLPQVFLDAALAKGYGGLMQPFSPAMTAE